MKRTVHITLLLLLSVISSYAQVFVTPSGAGAMDGTSWANAYGSLSLRNVLVTSAHGTQVWVAAGTYKPAVYSADSSFAISSGVQVYGGFAGTETTLGERNWLTNITILSGDIGAPGIDSDNTNHVVYFYSADATTVLDGFTIEHGYAFEDDSTAYRGYGGGILNEADSSNPLIRNCIFQNNYADRGGAGMAEVIVGGGLHSHISNCSFINNITGNVWGDGGGALALEPYGMAAPGIDTCTIYSTIDSCTFINNYNGAICIKAFDANCNRTISNCLIRDTHGSAIDIQAMFSYYGAGANISINNCHLTHNHLAGYGAAINCASHMGWYVNLAVDGCTIDSNSSGIDLVTDTTENVNYRISNTRFIDNADTSFAATRSVYVLTGSGCHDTLRVAGCSFFNRIPGYIGSLPDVVIEDGAINGHAYVKVDNSTFFKQLSAVSSYLSSNILFQMYSSTAATNSIDLDVHNSILYCSDPLFTPYAQNGPTATMHGTTKNSILARSGGSGSSWTAPGTDGGGNMDIYPMFADTTMKDLHIRCFSPAINNGDNSLIPSFLSTDLDGTARIKNGTVDIGAYEKDSTGCTTLSVNNEPKAPVVTIAPNPASDEFTASSPATKEGQLFLYDITGKIIYSASLTSGSTKVPVTSLRNGLYVCRILVDGVSYMRKIVVAH